MVLSMSSLHPLGHNDQNEVKYNFLSHVIPLVPALHYVILTASSMATFCSLDEDN